MMKNSILLLSLIACTQADPSPPQSPVDDQSQLFAADLDGDGVDELLAVKGNQVYWPNGRYDLTGSVLHHRVGTFDNTGRESVVLVTGRSRTHPKSAPAILQIQQGKVTPLYIGTDISERLTDIRIHPNGVFVTRIAEGKNAQGAWLKDGVFTVQSQAIMGLQQAPLMDGRVVVGRLYGDQPRAPGRLEVHQEGLKPIILGSLRGIRTLEVFDLDQDGVQDLLVGDGWHYKYGDQARARLVFYKGPDFSDRRVLAEIESAYTINRITPISFGESETPQILIETNNSTFLLRHESIGWRSQIIPPAPDATGTTVVRQGKNVWIYSGATPHGSSLSPQKHH